MAKLTKMQELICSVAFEVEYYILVLETLDAVAKELGASSWASCGSAVWNQFDSTITGDSGYIKYKETFICLLLAMSRTDLVAFFQTFTTDKLK